MDSDFGPLISADIWPHRRCRYVSQCHDLIMYLLRLLISTSDSLLQTRTSIQIASPKYAPWDPSVTMAMWANGFPHKHEGNKATAKEGLRIVWWMLPCNQRGQTIAPLRALWFYQAWYWLDLFCMLGKSFNFHFNSCAFKKLGENPLEYEISDPRSRFIKIPFECCKKYYIDVPGCRIMVLLRMQLVL